MDVRLYPARLSGTATAIPSKSAAHRALLCAAMCDGPTELTGLPSRMDASHVGADILATVGCIEALGGAVLPGDAAWRVRPCRPLGGVTLDCGESGSTLRFLLPVAAALTDRFTITGRGRLPERPLGALRAALEAHGCTFAGERLPLGVAGSLQPGEVSLPGGISSQFVTGLLLAAPLLGAKTSIHIEGRLESAGYVELTRAIMAAFGATTYETADGFCAAGDGYRSPGSFHVEGDWSNAAFFLAARSMGHAVEVSGLDPASRQPDRCCESLFARVGSGAHIDVSDCIDLAPVLAVRAAAADGETHIDGAARLRLKESDRLGALAEGLTALGAFVTERADGLTVHGGGVQGGTVDGYGDHRMVMSWAIAALDAREPVTVRGAEAVNKSYPEFFEIYTRLGGRCDVLNSDG